MSGNVLQQKLRRDELIARLSMDWHCMGVLATEALDPSSVLALQGLQRLIFQSQAAFRGSLVADLRRQALPES